MYKCPRCSEEKPINEFVKRTSRPSGVACCKACERLRKTEYAREYRVKNRETIRLRDKEYNKKYPDRIRKTNLKRFYCITPDQYEQMLLKQNNSCWICWFKHVENGKREQRLCVDHCHSSLKIRGLLCSECNKGLGHFRDNKLFLERAIQYLE